MGTSPLEFTSESAGQFTQKAPIKNSLEKGMNPYKGNINLTQRAPVHNQYTSEYKNSMDEKAIPTRVKTNPIGANNSSQIFMGNNYETGNTEHSSQYIEF